MLPLFGLFTNLFLCFYVLYINPKSKINQLFGFLTFSLALWSFGTFYMFNASSISEAFFWNKISTIGTVLTAIFIMHFSLSYCNKNIVKNKIFLIALYSLGFVFVLIEVTTKLFTENMISSYWGYSENPGVLFPILSLFVIIPVIFSFLLYYQLFRETSSEKIKKQSLFLIIAFLIPLIGGVATQVIAPYINVNIIHLTSTLTTFTALVIGFTVFKHNLLTPKSFSIQKKIVTMFFILLFCIMFFTLSTVRVVSNDVMAETVYDDLQGVAYSRADHVETLIKRDLERLSLVSSRTKLRMSLKNYNNLSNQNDKDLMEKILADANESIDDFEDIFIIDLSGICIVSTNPDYENMNYSNQDFFTCGKINNSLFLKLKNETPKIYISGPLTLNEDFLGVIVVVSSPNHLFKTLSDTAGLGETGQSYLVNESGFVISPLSCYNYTYNLENIILRKKIDTENYNDCMQHAKNHDLDKNTHEEIKFFKNYCGKKVLGTHVYIPEMKWGLLVEIDEEEAFASVKNMQNILTVIVTVSAIIVLFVAFFYSKTLSDPIKKLDKYSKEITEGNLNLNIDINSSDEIGSLAESFNRMTKSLKNHTENLEQQVDGRTKQLKEKIDELERFKKVTIGRELKMVELKKQIEQIKEDNNRRGKNS